MTRDLLFSFRSAGILPAPAGFCKLSSCLLRADSSLFALRKPSQQTPAVPAQIPGLRIFGKGHGIAHQAGPENPIEAWSIPPAFARKIHALSLGRPICRI